MIEVDCTPSEYRTPNPKMPVDFAAYLLSASPPGFDFLSLREQFRQDNTVPRKQNIPTILSRVNSDPVIHSIHTNTDLTLEHLTRHHDTVSAESNQSNTAIKRHIKEHCELQYANCNHNIGKRTTNESKLCGQLSGLDLAGNIVKDDEFHYHPRLVKSHTDGSLSSTGLRRSLGKKSVSFADDVGMSLVQVRLLFESSDQPPWLRPEVLSNLTKGASDGVTQTPPLVLNFLQPASDYQAFRDKLTRQCVSLENVILKDYNVLGTVKVKNIAFEKNVVIRCTFDDWESQFNIDCNYIPNCSSGGQFDTFSFEISVPPTMGVRDKVQFCVLYNTNGQEFWDSNDGTNYVVISADWKEIEEREKANSMSTKFSLATTTDWGQYSNWRHLDTSTPYW